MTDKTRGWNVVAELGNTEVPLSKGLLKLQVALGRIGEEKVLGWVKREIRGYGMDEVPPDYRRTESMTTGTFTDGLSEHSRVLALESFMQGDELDEMARPYIRLGVAGLENLSNNTSSSLEMADGRKILVKYHKELDGMLKVETPIGDRPVRCTRVIVEIPGTAPAETLSRIRSVALEVAVGLEREVPEVMREDGAAAEKAGMSKVRELAEKIWTTAMEEVVKTAVKAGVGAARASL